MEKYFDIQMEDIKFFREEMSEYALTEEPTTLYEVYIRVPEGTDWNAPTKYDTMMEELGYEFMDRDRFFDEDGNHWGGDDAPLWDKWFKFVPTIK